MLKILKNVIIFELSVVVVNLELIKPAGWLVQHSWVIIITVTDTRVCHVRAISCTISAGDNPMREMALLSSAWQMRRPGRGERHRVQSKSEIRLHPWRGCTLCSVCSPYALFPQTMGQTFHLVFFFFYPAGTGFYMSPIPNLKSVIENALCITIQKGLRNIKIT